MINNITGLPLEIINFHNLLRKIWVKSLMIHINLARSAKLPTGLYILLVLISLFVLPFYPLFIFFFNDFSETNYLRIRWTDCRNLFTE